MLKYRKGGAIMHITIELVREKNPSGKRIALMYYQTSKDSYQYYEVLSDGSYIATDTPIDKNQAISALSPNRKIPSYYKYLYDEGLLVVDLDDATWLLMILHIKYPGSPETKRYLLITARTDTDNLKKEIVDKLNQTKSHY